MEKTKEIKILDNALKLNVKREFLKNLESTMDAIPSDPKFKETIKAIYREIWKTKCEVEDLVEALNLDNSSHLENKTKEELLSYYKEMLVEN